MAPTDDHNKRYSPHRWEEKMSLLQKFKKTYGHCDVPKNYTDPSLAFFVTQVRKFRKYLSDELVNELNKIGFRWAIGSTRNPSRLEEEWHERFLELKKFFKEFGHTNITFKHDKKLAKWAQNQRALALKKNISPQRIKLLNSIAFSWRPRRDPSNPSWENNFEKLLELKKQNGHCRIVRKENPSLSIWASEQRKNKNRLSRKQIEKLNSIGFEWQPSKSHLHEAWEEQFEELKLFKKKHGHCNVPFSQPKTKLKMWVDRQRACANTISKARKKALNLLGFQWKLRRSA